MPDQDRNLSFMHTWRQDAGDGPRCPSCRGTGVTLQVDCVCCGREVIVFQVPKAEDITSSVKSLSIKTETVVPDGRESSPQPVIISSLVHESKPAILDPARPRPSNERQTRTRNAPNAPTLRSFNHSERPGVGAREGRYGSMGQLLQYGSRPSSSSRRGCANGARGRGAGRGAHQTFKGVRTREGVKGFLVEIRPPKWKKTIWLGTYNTSLEAAGAYDAGVFYTKKSNAKYNFQTSKGAFPPLPAHLQLDTADSMEEIKLFVQNQAREAARRMGSNNSTLRTSQHQQQQAQTSTVEHRDAVPATPAATATHQQPTSSGSCLTGTSDANVLETESNSSSQFVVGDFQIPMDLDYLGQCLQEETAAEEAANDMFLDYTNYVILQGGPDQQELLVLAEDV